ncbi:MAG TPA: indole-3-glycerol-phosphate synthase, partial [Candidatus Micrarchaeota archaeon]|nr:indole-3-glycerol-phosphate synthase [Candidatus Micrarchaeota archaeon]
SVKSGYYSVQGSPHKVKPSSLSKKLASQFVLITEIKHASPAGEYSFDNIDVEKTAMEFKRCKADAISVVVEQHIFKGNLANIPVAKKTGLPVLFKDFVVSGEQIKAAKFYGADAMLLVVKAIDRCGLDLDGMIEKAHKEGLEVLVEAYDEAEMKKAAKTGADMLGINNRDLETLKVDLARTKRIMESVGKIAKPVISESGIRGADDVRFVKQFGVKGVLVGTAIWKAPNLGAKVAELKMGATD